MLFLKRAFFTAAALILTIVSFESPAQDIKPEIAAQRMVDLVPGTSVNYNTGVMNYSIPLLNCSQDGFKVPISLEYSAGGIRVDEKPGILGIGWSLNYGGGIISRTVRGTYADEHRQFGILKHPIPATGSIEYEPFTKKIELGTTDGESDLFSLRVNGRLLHFFLKPSADTVVVEFLERTGVKIVCRVDTSSTLQFLKSWTVIDEQGNKYLFSESTTNVANVYNGVNTNGVRQLYAANWYLTEVECFNNDKISYEYLPEELLEIRNDQGVTYTRYGTPMITKDYNAIQLSLNQLAGAIVGDEVSKNKILNVVDALRNQKAALTESFERLTMEVDQSDMPFTYRNALNKSLLSQYLQQLHDINEQIQQSYAEINYSPQLIPYINAVIDAYDIDHEIKEQFTDFGQFNLYAQRLIKTIRFRNTVIDFDYLKTAYLAELTAKIASINYRTIAGDNLKEFRFSIDEKGFLKDVRVLSALNTLEKKFSFIYFDEELTLSSFSQDYWGYYNGQANESLLPFDPCYNITTTQNTAFPLFGPLIHPNSSYYQNTSHPPGDRLPYSQFSKARSLKSVTNSLGGITSFEYEGNDVYLDFADKNVVTGGIRIKSIKTEDATGQLRKINYKYAFPLLDDPSKIRSTGQLFEWGTRGFNDQYGYSSGTDTYVYSNMVYRGTNCLPGGANDVFYHYVEEQAEDSSAVGYKYFALDPLNTDSKQNLLDGKLMAQISYDANGRIVKIHKYQYTTNFGEPGNRSSEYSMLFGRGVPYLVIDENSTSLIRQYKKGGIYFDEADVQSRFSGEPTEFINVGGTYLQVPSMGKVIYDFQYPRSGYKTGFEYGLDANIFVRATASSVYTFPNYEPSEIPAVVPNLLSNEKGYLFEKLLGSGVSRIEQLSRFYYESALPDQVTRIEFRDSKGNWRATKYKYVCDYDSVASPFISQLMGAGRLGDIVETQQWLSTDGGSSYKFLSGEIMTSDEKTVEYRKFVLPVGKHLYLPQAPVDISIFGESMSGTGPYNSVFWENQNLYKPELAYRWQLNRQFARISGEGDKTEHFKAAICYDNISGNPLIKAIGVSPGVIAASDLSPYLSQAKYANRGWFKKSLPVTDIKVYTFNQKPFTNGLHQQIFFDYVTYFTGALHKYEEWVADQGVNIPWNIIVHPLMDAAYNLFQDIANKNELNSFIHDLHTYRKAMADESSVNDLISQAQIYLGSDFFEMFFALQAIDQMCVPDLSVYDRAIIGTPVHVPQPLTTPLCIKSALVISNLIDVFVLKEEFSNPGMIQYKVKYSNGTYSGLLSLQPSIINDRIAKATLDLTSIINYVNATEVQFVSSKSCYAVPQGVAFEAYSYLPDNNMMLSFNHTGRYTEKVYNEFGENEHVTDNKHVVGLSITSYVGKGDAVIPVIVPVKVINGNDPMKEGPVIKRISLENNYGVITESKVLIIPGQEYSFNAHKGLYKLVIEAEVPFEKVIINGIEYSYAAGYVVDLSVASQLLIQFPQIP